MSAEIADNFLAGLTSALSKARSARAVGGGGGRPRRPVQRRLSFHKLSERAAQRLMRLLDCDADGVSLRSGELCWPDSWPLAEEMCRILGADTWLRHVIASWLEGLSETTRKTYYYATIILLRDLRIYSLDDLLELPVEAGLTWQRIYARRHLPRSTNTMTGALNSIMRHASRLGQREHAWEPLPNVKITRGRHVDREAVVLTSDELLRYWNAAKKCPQRQFLAVMLASLHGLRACEVARIRWRDLRYARRGKMSAPAVLHIIGKGKKHRLVQVHNAIKNWIERERAKYQPDDFVLADANGRPPTAQIVGWWAKEVFRKAEIKGYGHALRATWATLALENKQNNPLEVQLSGGWKNQETMLGSYFKRRNVGRVRLFHSRH